MVGGVPSGPDIELDRQSCPLRGRHPVREQARIGFGQVLEEGGTVHGATMNGSAPMLKWVSRHERAPYMRYGQGFPNAGPSPPGAATKPVREQGPNDATGN
ncbi:MAG: hypothetical protein HoeaKO_23720 [Hoeflea alexandrii]